MHLGAAVDTSQVGLSVKWHDLEVDGVDDKLQNIYYRFMILLYNGRSLLFSCIIKCLFYFNEGENK